MSETVVLLVGKSSISSKPYNLELSGCYKCFHLELFSFLFFLLKSFHSGQISPSLAVWLPVPRSPSCFYSVPVILLAFLITLCSNPAFSSSSIKRYVRIQERVSSLSVQSPDPMPGARQSTNPKFQIWVPKKELLEILNENSWEDCNIFHGLNLKKKWWTVFGENFTPKIQPKTDVLCGSSLPQQLTSGKHWSPGNSLSGQAVSYTSVLAASFIALAYGKRCFFHHSSRCSQVEGTFVG